MQPSIPNIASPGICIMYPDKAMRIIDCVDFQYTVTCECINAAISSQGTISIALEISIRFLSNKRSDVIDWIVFEDASGSSNSSRVVIALQYFFRYPSRYPSSMVLLIHTHKILVVKRRE